MVKKTENKRANHLIHFEPEGLEVRVKEGQTLLDAARELGIILSAVCGGKGLCGRCRVEIINGWENLSAPSENEMKTMGETNESHNRLACCAAIKGPVSAFIPEEGLSGTIILTKGDEGPYTLDPVISKYHVRITPPDIETVARDGHHLPKIIEEIYGLSDLKIDDEVSKKLPEILEKTSQDLSIVIRQEKEIIDIEPGGADNVYGVAVDVGTTTVVGYLMDLFTGEQISVGAMTNPQVVYGEDVISRIVYAIEGDENRTKISKCIRDGLNHILTRLCKESGINREHIYEMTIAGNTAMHHILLDLDLKSLSKAPFTPALVRPSDHRAGDLNLRINGGGNIHVLPLIDSFVGADTVAVLICTQLHESEELSAVIDIGTNGEIVAGSKDKGLKCCSTAAGPAFEGGHIRFGMRAAQGAIEKVSIDPDTLKVNYRSIGGAPPRGICGSGIIDAVAQMIQCGLVQKNGRINADMDTPHLINLTDGPAFVLEWAEKTAIGRDIIITQGDIREVQLAKAALNAGAQVLMKHLGITKFDRIFLAGAFGNYIDRESALTLGLFPDCDPENIVTVGNAAGQGARLALLSHAKRQEAATIARAVEHIELSNDPEFERTFINATYFP